MAKKLLCVITLMLALVCVLASCGHEHNFGEWETTKDATCKESGTEERYCDCGETQTRDVAKIEHEYGEWTVTKNATCILDGTEERTCSCGAKETKPINALGHTEVVDSAIAATCTTEGKTEGKHCSVCNEILVVQNTVDALSHTEVIDEAIAPTYTTRGKTEGSHCSICKTVIIPQQDISTIWNGGITEPTSIVLIEDVYYYEINSAEELAFLSTATNEWCNYNYILKCNIVLNTMIEYEHTISRVCSIIGS